MCVFLKTKYFYSFINNSTLKAKLKQETADLATFTVEILNGKLYFLCSMGLILRHLLTTILDTKLKRFHGGFFELDMLEIFIRSFLLKSIIRT